MKRASSEGGTGDRLMLECVEAKQRQNALLESRKKKGFADECAQEVAPLLRCFKGTTTGDGNVVSQ